MKCVLIGIAMAVVGFVGMVQAAPASMKTHAMAEQERDATCPMHTHVRGKAGDPCPICGMKLEKMKSETHSIKMMFDEDSGEVSFEPKNLKIKSGDSVEFVQTDAVNVHNVMFEPNGVPKDAGIPMMGPEEMNKGDTWKVTFMKSGTYKFHCHPHYDMGMMGEIIVGRPSTPEEMAKGTSGHYHDGKHVHPMTN